MVTRAGDIQPHIGEAGGHEILLMDSTTFALTRIPSERFRGAGIFTGENTGTPPTAWVGIDPGGAYKKGDVYIQTNGSDVKMWQWNVAGSTWTELADFTPPVFHTAQSLGHANYETVATSVTDVVFAEGDFYRSLTTQRLYGPVITAGTLDFTPGVATLTFERPAKEYNILGTDLTWTPALIIDPTEEQYFPANGDTIHQGLLDLEHGGFKYTFDIAAYNADGGNIAAKLLAGWGTRSFYRSPKMFQQSGPPTDATHLNYIMGDYIFDTANRSIWGPYDSNADVSGATATARRDSAWGTTPDQNRLSHTHVLDSDVDYTPAQDNTTYAQDDMLLVRNIHAGHDLPIMYGPYTPSTPWPVIGVMRSPVTFEVNQATGTGGVFGAIPAYANVGDAVFTAQGLPFVGDSIVVNHIYPAGHATHTGGEATGLVDLFEVTAINYTTLAVTVVAVAEQKPRTVHQHTLAGRPGLEADTYKNGDFVRDSAGFEFGPYNSAGGTAILAWPLAPMRAGIEHQVTVVDNASVAAYDLSTLPVALAAQDTILFRITGSDKQVKYTIDKVNGAEEDYRPVTGFQLGERSNPLAAKWAVLSAGQPARDDETYSTGDMVISLGGIIYGPYLEGQNTDVGAYPPGANLPLLASTGNPSITQDVTSTIFEVKMDDNDAVYLEEQ